MRAPGRRGVGLSDPRYLRPGGNLRVRRRRRARTILRAAFWCGVWLAGAAAAGVGFSEGWRLLADPERFPLTRVTVQGGRPEVDREVEALLTPLLGRNVLTIDLAQIQRTVRDHPWVRSAAIQRRLPGGLLVVVTERRVAALVVAGDGVRMVDGDGADMGRFEAGDAVENHPVITGAVAVSSEETARRLGRGLEAARRLSEDAPDLLEDLSSLDVSRRDRLTATLRDFRPPVYLSPEDPARNVDRLPAIRGRLEAGGVEVEYVDLRFRDRIAVMPIREGVGERG